MRSDPDAGYVDLATRILAGGKERLGAQAADFTDPDALADAVIDAGCRAVQAADMQAHGNRLAKGSPGSRAQVGVRRRWRLLGCCWPCSSTYPGPAARLTCNRC